MDEELVKCIAPWTAIDVLQNEWELKILPVRKARAPRHCYKPRSMWQSIDIDKHLSEKKPPKVMPPLEELEATKCKYGESTRTFNGTNVRICDLALMKDHSPTRLTTKSGMLTSIEVPPFLEPRTSTTALPRIFCLK
jgi:hypothetical protein